MLEVRVTGAIGAPAARVWAFAGDFDGLPQWIPGIVASHVEGEGIGQIRHLTIQRRGPQFAQERLTARDDRAFHLVYEIVESSLPVSDYTSWFRLVPSSDGARCTLDWRATFVPANGALPEDACSFVEGAYRAGLASLQDRFGR